MIDHNLLGQIDGLVLSRRAAALREEFFATKPGVAAEHPVVAMHAWLESEGEPLDVRRAKLLQRLCEELPVPIFPGQKIAGSQTKYFRGAYPHPEFDGKYLLPLLDEDPGKMTLGGPVEKARLTPEDYIALRDAVEYWKGRTTVDHVQDEVRKVMGCWYDDLVEAGTNRYESVPQGPHDVRWDWITRRGLRAIVEDAEQHIRKWFADQDDDVDKLHFWQAVSVACESAIILARRYAQQARDLAAVEQDSEWRAELHSIAEVCDRVPEHAPRTFRDALQGLVLTHVALGLETPCTPPAGFGRVDRDLCLFMKRDLAEGRLTVEEAGDLVADFIQFIARQEWVMELSWRDYMQKGVLISIALGGTDAEGNDVCNELTYLILHMMGLQRYAEPHLAIGWHKGTPDWLVRKALETNWKIGGGVPQFQNCDHFVDYMVRNGVSLEAARNWTSNGCSQILPGDQVNAMEPSYINVAIPVDLALHNGVFSPTGKRLGPETGDPRSFRSFDDFNAAYKKQAEHLIRKQLWHDEIVDRVRAQNYRQPLASALLPGCMENGKDFGVGGLTHYRMHFKKDRGHIPAADSLTAVKKLVYDERKLTMAELLEAVDSNFAGSRGEQIRQLCLAAPKYGNDADEADFMLRDLAKFAADVITSKKNIWGYHYAINRNGQSWHYMAGKKLGALPNGRKAGVALADGSLSPTQGMDRRGPTALLNSAIKAGFQDHAIAGILTVKFPAPLFQNADLRDKVAALTAGFFDDGGTYLQYNVLDGHVLREAKLHPERYRDLVVRVGGYSAYFVNLSSEVQDEIIERTEHSLVGP